MPLIEWNDNFLLGIEKIDEQHKKFFSIINTLFDAMKSDKGEKVVDTILKELQDYVVYHFKTEEYWMKLCYYPDLKQHINEHQHAIEKVQELLLNYKHGNQVVIVEILKFLNSWLQNHILESDRKLIPFLRNRI